MKACKKCGETKQLEEYYKTKGTRDGRQATCKECVKARTKKYRKENPEKVAETSRKARERNRDKYREYSRNWYYSNREKALQQMRDNYFANHDEKLEYHRSYYHANRELISEKKKEYYRKNPELFEYHRRLRKARERESGIDFTLEEYYELMERFGGRCALTGSEDVHLDHFIPVHTGLGVTAVRNLIPLDARLNTSKGGQNPFEWINGQDSDIQTKFSEIVNYLAKLNGFTRDEYEAHVYNCFDN